MFAEPNSTGICRLFAPEMKFLSVLFFCLAALTYCTEKPPQSSENWALKFDSVWQIDADPVVMQVRTEIARQDPKSAYGLYCKAWLLARKGDLGKALKTADSLVMGFPQFDKGLYLRANLKAEQNDTEGAFSDFDKCLKRNPNFTEAYINRGALYFSSNHPDQALTDFLAANKLKTNDKRILLNIGNAQAKLGMMADACRNWHAADSLGEPQARVLVGLHCSADTLK